MSKNNKPFELQKIPTLKIEVTPDQAKQSNDLEKKLLLSLPPVPTDLAKKDIIKILEGMKNTIKSSAIDSKTLELVHILDFALQDYAKCFKCKGKGKVVEYNKPAQNYNVRTSPKGQKYYLIECINCRGSGKILDVQCASCGKNASIMPDQRHETYCNDCETRLIKSGVLL